MLAQKHLVHYPKYVGCSSNAEFLDVKLKLDGNRIYLLYTSSAIIQSMLEVLVMAGRRPKYPLHASLSLQASTFKPLSTLSSFFSPLLV